MSQLQPGAVKVLKLIGFLAFIAIVYFAKTMWWDKRTIDVSSEIKNVGKVALPDAPEASLSSNATKLEFPSKSPSINGGTHLIHEMMAWQSQNSWNYANGGSRTTKGSLFDKVNLDIELKRQDDCNQSVADFVKFCKDYKENPSVSGVCVTYMGTGIPNYATSILNACKELGPEYAPIVIFSSGKSYGEDQVIGDASIKNNPQSLKGQIVMGVRLDGDMDIAMKYANDNNIAFNPNPKYYDPNALNASYPSNGSFVESAVKYNAGTLERRTIVINGKTTGRDTMLAPTMVTTWFPADETALNGKGGVSIISTKEYASMMPNITIFCKKWVNDHRSDCENLVMALAQAGDQIRSFDDAKRYSCKLSAEIYGEKDETYWYNGFNGKKIGLNSHVGGSAVFNLKDMLNLFGLGDSKNDIYRAVYTTFGDLQAKYYPGEPQLHPYMDYSKLVDKSIMMSILSNHPELLEGKAAVINYDQGMTNLVASKSEHINFNTGSAQIQSNSYTLLNNIYTQLLTSEGLKVKLVGHTDNTGNPDKNRDLSLQRANSVRDYLIKKGIPSNRFETDGRGDSEPLNSNSNEAEKAENRRVEIILGN